jgi:hypothetical protein
MLWAAPFFDFAHRVCAISSLVGAFTRAVFIDVFIHPALLGGLNHLAEDAPVSDR